MFLDQGPSDSLQSFFILCILSSIKIQHLQSRANYDMKPQVPLKTNLTYFTRPAPNWCLWFLFILYTNEVPLIFVWLTYNGWINIHSFLMLMFFFFFFYAFLEDLAVLWDFIFYMENFFAFSKIILELCSTMLAIFYYFL